MNPSSPSQADMQYIERLLFQQMRYRTRMTINPELRRTAQQNSFLKSLDYQFSDLWLPEVQV